MNNYEFIYIKMYALYYSEFIAVIYIYIYNMKSCDLYILYLCIFMYIYVFRYKNILILVQNW